VQSSAPVEIPTRQRHTPSVARRLASESLYRRHLKLVDAVGSELAETKRFVQRCFADSCGASIESFLPRLLGMRNEFGVLIAALGLEAATERPLLAESHLDAPIQEMIHRRTGVAIERRAIVEVGNLSALYPGAARQLIVAATSLLHREGHQWAVLTGTASVRKELDRMGFRTIRLGRVRLECLAASDRARWSYYYQNEPTIVAGNISAAYHALARSGRHQIRRNVDDSP
jgi:hypothetical protein